MYQYLPCCKSNIMLIRPYKKVERKTSLYTVLDKIGCVTA